MFTISINLTLCIGYACRADKNPYRHDRRADKNLYLHDRRAVKNTYQHDRRADSQCLRIDTFRTGLVVRASDSGSGDPGSILGRVGVFVSLSKRHLLPKSTGNTQE